MRIDVSSICRQALSQAGTDAELDAAIEGACRDLHGEEAGTACQAIREMVTHYASSHKLPRLGAARALADATSVLDVTVHTSSGTPPPEVLAQLLQRAEPGKPYVETRVVRQVWTSTDGTPPPEYLARLLETGIGRKRRVGTFVTLPGGVRLRAWVALVVLLALVAVGCLLAILAAGH